MSKVRFLLVGAGAALALVAGGALANVGALTHSNSDSHGDTVASAARTSCPHGPNGVHGKCVSAIAKTDTEAKEAKANKNDACEVADVSEDISEKTAERNENASEKAAHTSKAADKTEDASEKAADKAEDKIEKAQAKACKQAAAANH